MTVWAVAVARKVQQSRVHIPTILILSPSKEELQRHRNRSSSFDGLKMKIVGCDWHGNLPVIALGFMAEQSAPHSVFL
jgi:hypothetical protein